MTHRNYYGQSQRQGDNRNQTGSRGNEYGREYGRMERHPEEPNGRGEHSSYGRNGERGYEGNYGASQGIRNREREGQWQGSRKYPSSNPASYERNERYYYNPSSETSEYYDRSGDAQYGTPYGGTYDRDCRENDGWRNTGREYEHESRYNDGDNNRHQGRGYWNEEARTDSNRYRRETSNPGQGYYENQARYGNGRRNEEYEIF